ncbi:4'-phosphopantetheinyl transferase superfamily protein [Streptomyces cirratus]|uniref:4'-phosphopantetheinyl transferase superfamily protein n=1 Tax=Streptomyces cirratus TaxID=68187 RepID=UPI00360DDEF3
MPGRTRPLPRAPAARPGRRSGLADGRGRQHHALRRLPRGRGGPVRPYVGPRHRRRARGSAPGGRTGAGHLPAERDHLRELAAAHPGVFWDRLLFCAKEAVYKAWYPATGVWLGFRDATVALSPDGTFTCTLDVPAAVSEPVDPLYRGRWSAGPELVLTVVVRRD